MAKICSICAKVSEDAEEFQLHLCKDCINKIHRISFEPKVKPLHADTRHSNKDFLAVTIIVLAFAGIYLFLTDPTIKNNLIGILKHLYSFLLFPVPYGENATFINPEILLA